MPFSKSRLYLTQDIYGTNVWFVRTEVERFARLQLVEKEVTVWFYPFSYEKVFTTLTEALKYVEKSFIRYYYEKYFKSA